MEELPPVPGVFYRSKISASLPRPPSKNLQKSSPLEENQKTYKTSDVHQKLLKNLEANKHLDVDEEKNKGASTSQSKEEEIPESSDDMSSESIRSASGLTEESYTESCCVEEKCEENNDENNSKRSKRHFSPNDEINNDIASRIAWVELVTSSGTRISFEQRAVQLYLYLACNSYCKEWKLILGQIVFSASIPVILLYLAFTVDSMLLKLLLFMTLAAFSPLLLMGLVLMPFYFEYLKIRRAVQEGIQLAKHAEEGRKKTEKKALETTCREIQDVSRYTV